jgi:hypothetical protein
MPIIRIEYKLRKEFNAARLVSAVHQALKSDPTVKSSGTMVFADEVGVCSVGADNASEMVFMGIHFMESKDDLGIQKGRTPEEEAALMKTVFDAAVENVREQGCAHVLLHFVRESFPRADGILTHMPEAP